MKTIILISLCILMILLVACTAKESTTYEVKKVGQWEGSNWGKCQTRDNTTMRCADCQTDSYSVCNYGYEGWNGVYVCWC